MTVMIGIDPHRRSHTVVALDENDAVLPVIDRATLAVPSCEH